MNSLNQIILEGNVCRQPEKREYKGGFSVCTIPIACNRYYKDNEGKKVEETSFFEVTALGKLADICTQWCPKGRGIRVVGRLKQDRWEDENGKKQSKMKILAEHIEFRPMKKDGGVEEGPATADSGKTSVSKKQKLALLAQAAQAAQYDDNEEVPAF